MDELNLSEPVACTPTSAAQRAVIKRIRAELAPRVLTRERLLDGVCLRFAVAPGLRKKIDQLVELDKGCCAFLEYKVESDAQIITLTVRSQGRGIALAQEFPEVSDSSVGTR